MSGTGPSASAAMAKAESAHQKIDSHEELCAERYGNINDTLSDLKDTLKSHQSIALKVLGGLATGVLGLLGWMAVQLWAGQVAHPANPPVIMQQQITPGP